MSAEGPEQEADVSGNTLRFLSRRVFFTGAPEAFIMGCCGQTAAASTLPPVRRPAAAGPAPGFSIASIKKEKTIMSKLGKKNGDSKKAEAKKIQQQLAAVARKQAAKAEKAKKKR